MTDQQTQITYLAVQVDALKIVIGMIDSALRTRGIDSPVIMNEAFDQAVCVMDARRPTPARQRARLVVKDMQRYLGASGPVSAAGRKSDVDEKPDEKMRPS